MFIKDKNKRYIFLTFFYLLLTFGLVFVILKFGISGAVKISELLQEKGPEDTSSTLYENVLLSPQLYPLPEATNSATLPVSGYSQPNKKIDIYLNEFNIETFDIDSEGKFEGSISLSLGLSNIYAITKDAEGKQSAPSKTFTVFYSNSPPSLEITEPENGSTIKREGNIFIKGKVHETSKVSINNHVVVVDKNGNFSYPVKLEPGENKFKIVCLDPAQNKTEAEWIVNFQR